MEATRLNKYLAQCGVCSRREADKLIEAGKVLVNGQIADMGCKVTEVDVVQVGKKVLGGKAKTAVLAFYKPVGVTCTEKDKYAEKMVNDYIRQNEERKAERNAIYNPTTGEGCLSCERLDFHVPDMGINHYQIPFDCFDEKIIRDLHEIGSVKAYLKA